MLMCIRFANRVFARRDKSSVAEWMLSCCSTVSAQTARPACSTQNQPILLLQLRLAARNGAGEKTPRGPPSGREGTPRGEGGSARAGSKTPRDESASAALGSATSPNQRSRKLLRTAHSSGDTSWRSGVGVLSMLTLRNRCVMFVCFVLFVPSFYASGLLQMRLGRRRPGRRPPWRRRERSRTVRSAPCPPSTCARRWAGDVSQTLL